MDGLSNIPSVKAELARERAEARADAPIASRRGPGDAGVAGAKSGAGDNRAKIIERKAENLESVFLSNMLQPMFEGLKTGGMFGGGHGEKMFRQELVQEYANKLAEGDSLGLTEQIKRELMKTQEVG